jgi:NAD(P)-dependent dehydrogenase (short-subunit alcohol dehydrogenase family)
MAIKTWFITGTSRGFGREWTKAALERGDRVAATARDTSTLADLASEHGDALLPLALDVTDPVRAGTGARPASPTARRTGWFQSALEPPARRSPPPSRSGPRAHPALRGGQGARRRPSAVLTRRSRLWRQIQLTHA